MPTKKVQRTLAVNKEVKESKSSRRWPSTTRLKRGNPSGCWPLVNEDVNDKVSPADSGRWPSTVRLTKIVQRTLAVINEVNKRKAQRMLAVG